MVNREAWGWRGTFATSWEEVKAALGRKTVKKEDATAKQPTQKIIQSSTLIRFHLNQGSSGVVIYRTAIIVLLQRIAHSATTSVVAHFAISINCIQMSY